MSGRQGESQAMQTAASVRERLLALSEPGYQAFVSKLIPNVEPGRILGIRTPLLRQEAKLLRGTQDGAAFLQELPHRYLEENSLHAYLLGYERDYSRCLELVESFLPYVDNWAVCDGLSLPCFRRHRQELLGVIPRWLASDHTYTVRFGVKMLMDHFLEKDFLPLCPELAASVCSEEYYVNMMLAWYFATALAKQWEHALPYLTEHRLSPWVHNKSIQKAVESRRLGEQHKQKLRDLRWKTPHFPESKRPKQRL